MDPERLQALLRERFSIRVERETGAYVLRRLARTSGIVEIPVLGGDARTGVATRRGLSVPDLQRALGALIQ